MADMLNTAVSGLLAFQQELDTTSNNISNANTPGYSRETTDLVSVPGPYIGDLSIGEASVLVVPGWNGSGAGHWQTLWEQKYLRFRRVEQRNWTRPPREEWIGQIGDDLERARTSIRGRPLRGPARRPAGRAGR